MPNPEKPQLIEVPSHLKKPEVGENQGNDPFDHAQELGGTALGRPFESGKYKNGVTPLEDWQVGPQGIRQAAGENTVGRAPDGRYVLPNNEGERV